MKHILKITVFVVVLIFVLSDFAEATPFATSRQSASFFTGKDRAEIRRVSRRTNRRQNRRQDRREERKENREAKQEAAPAAAAPETSAPPEAAADGQ